MRRTRKPPRAPVAAVVVNGQTLSGVQLAMWRSSEEEAVSPAFAARARAAAKFQALEAELERRRQARALADGLNETLSLARARGEEVDVTKRDDAVARVRVRSRDGLESLVRTGAISEAQFRAGLLYRDLYEASDPERDLRSQMATQAFLEGGGRSAGPARPEAWAERRLRLSRGMASIEAKVRLADRNGRAVSVLRSIAGHGRCLSHLSTGGGGQAVHRESLILALDIVAEHFGVR